MGVYLFGQSDWAICAARSRLIVRIVCKISSQTRVERDCINIVAVFFATFLYEYLALSSHSFSALATILKMMSFSFRLFGFHNR